MTEPLGEISGVSKWYDAFDRPISSLLGSASASGIVSASAAQPEMRDFRSYAVGLLRFRANLKSFAFSPSIGMVAKDIAALADALADCRVPLTRSVKQVIIPSIEKNFAAEGRPEWESLAQSTVKQRAKQGFPPGPTLVRTGKLKRAATSFDLWAIGPTSATIRQLPPNVRYGYVHQAGYVSSGGSGGGWFEPYKVRARQMLGKGASNKAVEKAAWKLFDERLTSAGPRTPRGDVSIPQRRYVMFQEQDYRAIQEVFYDWMDEEIVRVGKFVPGRF